MSPWWTPAENRRVGGKSCRARIVLGPCLGAMGGAVVWLDPVWEATATPPSATVLAGFSNHFLSSSRQAPPFIIFSPVTDPSGNTELLSLLLGLKIHKIEGETALPPCPASHPGSCQEQMNS